MAQEYLGSNLGQRAFAGTTIYPELTDKSYPIALVTHGWCTGVPTDTTASRYAPGCVLVRTDAGAGGGTQYVNVGTTAAVVWRLMHTPNMTAAGQSALNVAHAIYSFAVDGGTAGTITPVSTAAIPDNAIIVGGTVNSSSVVTSASNSSVSVGVSAGASPTTTAILGVTADTTFSADALVNTTRTFASPLKMTAAGNITFTITGGNLTAGIIEAFVCYVVALN